MTRNEFSTWLSDFSKRFPDLGQWMKGKPATLDVWYQDCFEGFELRDCMAVNIQMMTEGTLLEPWARDRIPSLFIKKTSEVRHARQKREDDARGSNHFKPFRSTVLKERDFRSMRQCFQESITIKAEHRHAFIEQFFDSPDHVKHAVDWVDDPSWLQEPKRNTLFAKVPTEEEVNLDAIRQELASKAPECPRMPQNAPECTRNDAGGQARLVGQDEPRGVQTQFGEL